jgi:pimeloyl-ACP methyl ester carboxylesterase
VQLLGGEAGCRLAQQQTEAIAAALPYGRLEVFDRSGHYPFVEVQERFAAVVGAFLLGRPLSRSPGTGASAD